MRLLPILAGFLFASFAHAADLAGTYVLENRQGRIVAKLDVRGERLTGTLDVMGKVEMTLTGSVTGDSASGTIYSTDGAGTFEAMLHGDVLNLTLSQKDSPSRNAAKVPMQLRRADTAPAIAAPVAPVDDAGGDRRLVGRWIYQDIVADSDVSFASEEHMAFDADGSYLYEKADTSAYDEDRSFDRGKRGKVERARWRAQDGVLYVLRNGDWIRIGKYSLSKDGRTMRIAYNAGNRKLWSRQ